MEDAFIRELKQAVSNDNEKELITKLNEQLRETNKELLKYKVNEILNRKQFKYILCHTKKGNKFIKIVYDSYEVDGWVEIARIHLSKSEWVRNRFSIEDVLEEVKC